MPRSTQSAATPAKGTHDVLLTASEAARRLGYSTKTLQNWALTWDLDRRGPRPIRLSPGRGGVRYLEAEVDQIIQQAKAGKLPLAPR